MRGDTPGQSHFSAIQRKFTYDFTFVPKRDIILTSWRPLRYCLLGRSLMAKEYGVDSRL